MGKQSNVNTTELDKMLAVKEKSQVIGEFLDWLQHEKNVSLTVNDLQHIEVEREIRKQLKHRRQHIATEVAFYLASEAGKAALRKSVERDVRQELEENSISYFLPSKEYSELMTKAARSVLK